MLAGQQLLDRTHGLCDLITEAVSSFCNALFVSSKSLGSARTHEEEGVYTGMNTKSWEFLGAISKV